MSYLNQFLEVLKAELPAICADKDLVEHLPNIFKSLSTVHRMRYRGQVPAYFSIEPNIYYLRDDVICWLRERYQSKEVSAQGGQIKSARKSREEGLIGAGK
jgi:hypothetical protein